MSLWGVESLIAVLAGLGLGGLATFALLSSKLSRERQKTETLLTQVTTQDQTIQDLTQSLEGSRTALNAAQIESASLRATLEAVQKSDQQTADAQANLISALKLELDNQLRKQVQESQKTLADQSHRASQVATEQLLQQLKQVVAPLSEKVTAFQSISEKTLSDQGGLKQQLDTLHAVTQRLGNALTHNKGRGNWGELQLELLLKDSGLEEHSGYEKQPLLPNGTRPDFKIRLSDDRALFVDVKALQWDPNAEEDVAQTVEERLSAVCKRHAQSLRAAVDELSKKAYPQIAKSQGDLPGMADYVVLYVPRESMIALALEFDPNLFEYAYKKNILLSGPFNMMGLLKLIHHGWQMIELSKEAKEIEKLGVAVHQKSALMFERFASVGKTIETLNEKFNGAMITFQGRDSVLSKLKRIEALGCKSDKTLPEEPPMIDEPYVFHHQSPVIANSLQDNG